MTGRGHDFGEHEELIQLPIELTNGNDGRGGAFWSSAKLRKQIEQRLVDFRREPFAHPTAITITRVLGPGQRLWDNDSIGRGNAKELIDSLVALGWWHDDRPQWISQVDYRQDATRRSVGPVVEIAIRREA